MRVLLDESLPKRLVRAFEGHEAFTVTQMGWSSTVNGALLRRAVESGFTALVTADQSMEYQQSVQHLDIAVIVLLGRTNRIEHLEPLFPRLLETLPTVRGGSVYRFSWRDLP